MSTNHLIRFGAASLLALMMGCAAGGAPIDETSEPAPNDDELKPDDDRDPIGSDEAAVHDSRPVLVGRWNFNEDGGQILRDSSGSGNHAVRGTNVSQQSSDPRRISVEGHRALQFDGNNDVARVVGRDRLQPREVSVVAWIRMSDRPSGTQYIVSKGAQGCVAPSYGLYFDNGQLKFIVTHQGSSSSNPFRETNGYSANNLDDNDWHQIVGTYDGRRIRLYVDGDLVDSTTYDDTSYIRYGLSEHNRLLFGEFDGAGSGCQLNYEGQLDNVRVYRNPLSAREVRDLND